MEANKQELGEMIFEILTEDYKDKIDRNKDLYDYLKENTKHDLLSLYLLYGYAGNNEYIVEEIVELQNKKKDEIIDRIIKFLDIQIVSILHFFNNKRIEDTKDIATIEGEFKYSRYEGKKVSFDTVKILKQLHFIFCKKEKDGIVIHMPEFIRNKISNICGDLHLEFYDEIILYTKGMTDTYGIIDIQDAYDIIKNDVLINFERYDNIIKFVSLVELEPIYYSFEHQCICSFNVRDEEIEELLEYKRDIIIYNKKTYEDIANDTYLMNLKEYKEFRNYLKEYFRFDINDEDMLREEIINDYIDNAQLDKKEAKNRLLEALEENFDIENDQKDEIINYIEKIASRMPKWKQGGIIEKEIYFEKIGRNDPCPCGSGKKYKNCHGK